MKRAAIWTGGVLALISSVGIAAYLWASRDYPATHPTLADATLPDLIPVRDFWLDISGEWAYKPSVDGDYIAYSAVRRASEVVVIEDTENRDEKTAIKDVSAYYWSDIGPNLYARIDGRLWRIDATAPDRTNWKDVTPRGFHGWDIANRVTSGDDRWVVTSRDRNPALVDIYTTRQDGGGKELLLQNEGQTLGWMMSKDLRPIMRFDRHEDEHIDVLVRDQNQPEVWRTLITVHPTDHFVIYEVTTDEKYALATSSRGRDKSAIVRVHLDTGEEEVLLSDAEIDLIWTINLDPHDGEIDLVYDHGQNGTLTPLSQRGERLARLVNEFGERVFIDSVFWSGKGRYVTATLSPDALNFEYALFDLEEETTTHLGTFSFRQRHSDKLVRTQEVMIPARDGLTLPSVMMMPQGAEGPVPFIVEVHGGPAQHVVWRYDHFRQFLVNRGYGVLAVNFRGSTGYGKAFQTAAFGEFGRAMQDDLYDAAQWAIDQGLADPDALAIIGGSYGGYAAAMAATDPASPFDAAIIEHAVLDVEYQMRNNPFAWGLNAVYMERYFGTLENENDVKNMRQYSPINRAEDLAMPAMLVAGKQDRVVGFEQTEEFLRRTHDAEKDVTELIFEDEGHGVSKWQNSIRHARAVEAFLARHLGGRNGGWDISEAIADYVE